MKARLIAVAALGVLLLLASVLADGSIWPPT